MCLNKKIHQIVRAASETGEIYIYNTGNSNLIVLHRYIDRYILSIKISQINSPIAQYR